MNPEFYGLLSAWDIGRQRPERLDAQGYVRPGNGIKQLFSIFLTRVFGHLIGCRGPKDGPRAQVRAMTLGVHCVG